MKLDTLKSAEVIDDPEQMVGLLGKHRDVSLRDDGQVYIKGKGSRGLKAAPPAPSSEGEVQRLIVGRGLEYEDWMKDRVVPYWLSDERPDGHGDITLQNWDTRDYVNNPVMAFNHSWDSFSVGVGLQEQVLQRNDPDYNGPALHFLGLFANYPFADQLYRLVKSRFFRGISPGFSSKRIIDVKDQSERDALGLGRYGYILDENVLLEASPTLLGANPGAVSLLTKAKDQVGLQGQDIELIRELVRQTSETAEDFLKADRAYRAAASVVFPSHDFKAAKFDEPIVVEERNRKMMIVKSEDVEEEEGEEPEDSETTSTEDRLDRIEAAFNELASYIGTLLPDIRDGVEALLEGGSSSDEEEDEDLEDEETETTSRSLNATLQRLESMLSTNQ